MSGLSVLVELVSEVLVMECSGWARWWRQVLVGEGGGVVAGGVDALYVGHVLGAQRGVSVVVQLESLSCAPCPSSAARG